MTPSACGCRLSLRYAGQLEESDIHPHVKISRVWNFSIINLSDLHSLYTFFLDNRGNLKVPRSKGMPKRIPHSESEVITGEQAVREYSEMQSRLGRFYLKQFLSLLKSQKKTGDFLEIGPGPGYQTVKVAESFQGARIQALEPSADMIQIARTSMEQRGLSSRVHFFEGSVEDEQIVESLGRFDLIYSSFSLHHWSNPTQAFHNLYRVLREQGVILIYDFERHWLTYHNLPLLRKGISESVRASYTLKEITSMIASSKISHFEVRRHFPYLSINIYHNQIG
jgi:ubiquinone/menaquinone biosynthesis C-methylase UbiE